MDEIDFSLPPPPAPPMKGSTPPLPTPDLPASPAGSIDGITAEIEKQRQEILGGLSAVQAAAQPPVPPPAPAPAAPFDYVSTVSSATPFPPQTSGTEK